MAFSMTLVLESAKSFSAFSDTNLSYFLTVYINRVIQGDQLHILGKGNGEVPAADASWSLHAGQALFPLL